MAPQDPRTAAEKQKQAEPSGRGFQGLDWIDLLLLLVIVYLTLLFVHWTGWRPRKSWIGLVLAPVVFGALRLRQQVLPSQRRLVVKGFTFGGFFATLFLVFGFLAGTLGGYLLLDMSSEEPEPVTEADVEMWITPRVTAYGLQGLANAEIRELTAEEAAEAPPAEVVTDVDELVKTLELGKEPPEEELERYRDEARQELEAEALQNFNERRARGHRNVLVLGGISLVLLLAGGFLDSRRKAHPAAAMS